MDMERLTVYCRGAAHGEATLEKEDGRVDIRLAMDDPGDGLYRAMLVGTRGQLPLGVLEPGDGCLTLRRRPCRGDVERLGGSLRVQTECSFAFRKKHPWQKTACPAELVNSGFLRERLAGVSRAWWRRGKGNVTLALAWEEGQPFPLEALFCFGRVDAVDGCRCVIYTFDEQGAPL